MCSLFVYRTVPVADLPAQTPAPTVCSRHASQHMLWTITKRIPSSHTPHIHKHERTERAHSDDTSRIMCPPRRSPLTTFRPCQSPMTCPEERGAGHAYACAHLSHNPSRGGALSAHAAYPTFPNTLALSLSLVFSLSLILRAGQRHTQRTAPRARAQVLPAGEQRQDRFLSTKRAGAVRILPLSLGCEHQRAQPTSSSDTAGLQPRARCPNRSLEGGRVASRLPGQRGDNNRPPLPHARSRPAHRARPGVDRLHGRRHCRRKRTSRPRRSGR